MEASSSAGRQEQGPERCSTGDYSEPLCCHEPNGRNLIVCIDGTSNQFGMKNTNVIELYNLILKEDNQRTWYNSGIGTYARPSWKSLKYYQQVLHHKIDLAIAWGFERTVLGAYRWLSDNYEKGDRIFLFGFSRGAYQIRVLSAMIDKVGLIQRGNEMQIPFAFELYADRKTGDNKVYQVGSQTKKINMAARFKSAFSNDVKVHFIGAWDTVSSIGIMRGKKMLPGTMEGMKHVCYFRHALALDERRVRFLPEYTYGGAVHSELPTDNRYAPEVAELQGKHPHSLEVWFAGTHSDIGGGNAENAGMDRRKPPLRWIVLAASTFGLRTAQLEDEFLKDDKIDVLESLTWPWWILEVLPLKRLTFTRRDNARRRFTYMPHLGSPRKIHPGQKIHHSVLLSDSEDGYTPKARPSADNASQFWNNLRRDRLQSEWLEYDFYGQIHTIVERLLVVDNDKTSLQTLHQIAKLVDGRQAVYDKVVEALNRNDLTPDIKYKALKALMDILKTSQASSRIKARITKFPSEFLLNDNKEYLETVRSVMMQYTDCCVHEWSGEIGRIFCVAFSSDGERVLGSINCTIWIWDVKTGKPLREPLRHSDLVRSVAFSSDGKRVVGSIDKTIQIWGVEPGEAMRQPFIGHTSHVTSVAFSPDDQHVVSGSIDKTIRIWNVKTGEPLREPLRGHSYGVRSVAFSPNGKLVVSGSGDETVRIWDVKTGEPYGEPFIGHSSAVTSVAFSPDGERVVSGSYDRTIRIWDVKTGEPSREPFRGHSDYVTSVAFSPDGERVISGSIDKTIRIWNVKTGEPSREPFRGHSSGVTSVAFSPDGEHVVSGSSDGTVRIWLLVL